MEVAVRHPNPVNSSKSIQSIQIQSIQTSLDLSVADLMSVVVLNQIVNTVNTVKTNRLNQSKHRSDSRNDVSIESKYLIHPVQCQPIESKQAMFK